MSSRRLPVIFFVSLVEFLTMFMLGVARSACGGWRRLLHCLRAIARLPLRLVHSLLFLLPPRCSIRNLWLSDFSYLMIPIYDASSISYAVSQLSLCVNYNTLTVDGFCKAIISCQMQNPLTYFCIWQPSPHGLITLGTE